VVLRFYPAFFPRPVSKSGLRNTKNEGLTPKKGAARGEASLAPLVDVRYPKG